MRKKAVDAAERLFFSNGYENVSLDKIADGAGFDKLTLSFYFKDAEAVFYAVAVRGAGILHRLHAAGSPLDTSGIEKVLTWVRVSHEFSDKYPDYFRMLGQAEAKRCDLSGIEDAIEIVNLLNRILIMLIEAIKMGMDDGSIRKDLDPRETAILIALMQTSVLRLDHGRKTLLDDMKIDGDRFAYDFRYFVARAIANGLRTYS
jgi:AcrR family transcriptional regulator